MNYNVYKSKEEKIFAMDDIPASPLPDTIPYEVLRPHLVDSWKYVDGLDKGHIFAEKVTDQLAPGYSHMIKKPMYMSLIKANIKDAKYVTLESFSNDVILMLKNAFHFNGVETAIGKIANRILTNWLNKKKDVETALLKELKEKNVFPISSVGPETPAPPAAVPKKNGAVISPTAEAANHIKDKNKAALVASSKPPIPPTPKVQKQDPVDVILPLIATNDAHHLHNLKEITAEAWYYLHKMDVLKLFGKV
jgi:hypothetical protein